MHLHCAHWSPMHPKEQTHRGNPTLNMRRFLGNMSATHHFAPPAHKCQSKDRPTAGTPLRRPIAAATRPCSCSPPTLGGPKLISNGRGGASKLAPRRTLSHPPPTSPSPRASLASNNNNNNKHNGTPPFRRGSTKSVSYTHLTLPTTHYV